MCVRERITVCVWLKKRKCLSLPLLLFVCVPVCVYVRARASVRVMVCVATTLLYLTVLVSFLVGVRLLSRPAHTASIQQQEEQWRSSRRRRRCSSSSSGLFLGSVSVCVCVSLTGFLSHLSRLLLLSLPLLLLHLLPFSSPRLPLFFPLCLFCSEQEQLKNRCKIMLFVEVWKPILAGTDRHRAAVV